MSNDINPVEVSPRRAALLRLLDAPSGLWHRLSLLAWPVACGFAAAILWFSVEEWNHILGAGMAPLAHAYASLAREYLLVSCLLLLALAATGMLLTARLAGHKRQAEEVRAACLQAMDGQGKGYYLLGVLRRRGAHGLDFIVRDCDATGASHAGIERQAALGKRLSEFGGNPWIDSMDHPCRRAMAEGWHCEEMRMEDGAWLQRRYARCAGLVITVRDVSALKAEQEKLARLAHVDPLTGLPNRQWLMDFLPRAIDAAAGTSGLLAVLFVDLDDFKSINDSHGHDVGDALLQAAAGRLAAAIRLDDKLSRLGGDEFVIVLEQVQLAEIVHVAERVVAAMSEDFVLSPSIRRQVHASVGISLCPREGAGAASLLRSADQAMYLAKSGGKGRFAFHAGPPARDCATPQPASASGPRA